MTQAPKTVLAIHDLPGFGRAALSVIVPVLSALGVQAVAVPTAVLSTHTGGLGTPSRLSSPGYAPGALAHYQRLGLQFDCIYSGYLAAPAQARLVEHAFDLWPQAYKVVDPVMGDAGHLYRGLDADIVPAFTRLCRRADLILPNTTEAALLLGEMPQPAVPLQTAASMAAQLTGLCPQVVVTGAQDGHSLCNAGAAQNGEGYCVRTPRLPRMFHGTGDIFGAVVVGRMLQGNVPQAAVQAASAFVAQCLRATPEGADERLGVWLEAALPALLPPQ